MANRMTKTMQVITWQKAIMAAAVVFLVITAFFVWTKLRQSLIPTETVSQTTQETTTAATAVVPKWEEQEVFKNISVAL